MTTFDHGGNVFTVARALGVRPEEIIDFSASINPLGVGPRVREALLSSFSQLTHYPDADLVELNLALAAYHNLDPGHIAAANGSTELIYLLPRLISGRKALIVAPAFSEYAKALTREGWDVAYHELLGKEDFALSLDRLERHLGQGFDALFLCNPGNPTGTLLSPGTIKEVYNLCRQSGTFLVLDEAFMDFCEDYSAKHLVSSGGGVILRSMTKFFAIPGLRLGYAIGSPELVADLTALREPWSVNTPAQVAGVAALEDSGYRFQTLQLIGEERAFLAAGLGALAGLKVHPSAANYLLVETGPGLSATELRESLLPLGILIRDCSNFQGLDKRYFRVAVRSRSENEQLLRQLERVLA